MANSGLWTPRLEGKVVAGDHTYLTQRGSWYRVTDELVLVQFHIKLSAKDPLMNGAVKITGSPFTRNQIPSENYGIQWATVAGIIMPPDYCQLIGTVEKSENEFLLNIIGTLGQLDSPLYSDAITDGTKFSGTCMYSVVF